MFYSWTRTFHKLHSQNLLQFSRVTGITHTGRRMKGNVHEKTYGLLPTGAVRAVLRASLPCWHLSTGTTQLLPAKLWCFKHSSMTALGKHWLLSGNQYNYSIHESERWTNSADWKGTKHPIAWASAMSAFLHCAANATWSLVVRCLLSLPCGVLELELLGIFFFVLFFPNLIVGITMRWFWKDRDKRPQSMFPCLT